MILISTTLLVDIPSHSYLPPPFYLFISPMAPMVWRVLCVYCVVGVFNIDITEA